MKITPILFLDLDGTVRYNGNDPKGFINSPADVEIFDGVLDILKSYKARGWRIVAISNQGGIALGHIDEHTVARCMEETNRMCARLFDRMQWCTHHPDAVADEEHTKEEKSICLCRKPNVGMVVSMMMSLGQEHNDETYRGYASLFVGDREEDRKCAENACIPYMDAKEWRKKGPLTL